MGSSMLASLGCDFGSYSSKCAFAYQTDDGKIQLLRVILDVDGREHPEKDPQDKQQVEFVALAGLDGNQLTSGRRALFMDVNFPLKTILLIRSGITRPEILAEVPGGKELYVACHSGRITPEAMDAALTQHFSFLRDQCLLAADNSNIVINRIVFSYPNYLREDAQEGDQDQYIVFYRRLLRRVWKDYPQPIEFESISEGQATALYITDAIHVDERSTSNREKIYRQDLRELFDTVDQDQDPGVTIVVFDFGSSSLNIQSQTAYFDEEGDIKYSQSNVGENWHIGGPGGSHNSNAKVKEIVKQKLSTIYRGHIPNAEIARMAEDFERQKASLHWNTAILLHGSDKRSTVRLSADCIQEVFEETFGRNIQLIRENLECFRSLGKPFGIVFCGGSFSNPGLRKAVDRLMDDIKRGRITPNRTLVMAHTFLQHRDNYWMTGVSVGAAFSGLNLPLPIHALVKSGIGIQRVVAGYMGRKVAGAQVCWDKELYAPLLLAQGCGEPRAVIFEPHRSRMSVKFVLVCDPTYTEKNHAGHFTGIELGLEEDVVHGPVSPYDLDFEIKGAEIPPGDIQFRFGGSFAQAFASQDRRQDSPYKGEFELVLTCESLVQGMIRFHERARRWKLTIKTDPGSRLPIIDTDTVMNLPLWCRACQRRVTREPAWMCQTCKKCTFCEPCYSNRASRHVHNDFSRFERPNTGNLSGMEDMTNLAAAGTFEGTLGETEDVEFSQYENESAGIEDENMSD